MKSLAQQDDATERATETDENATEKEPELPACNGSNGPKKVNCIEKKPLKVCKGNKLPKLQPGEEAWARHACAQSTTLQLTLHPEGDQQL